MSRREDPRALQCKVELADWCETADTGCTVTFRLCDSESVALLKAALACRPNDADACYLLYLLKAGGASSTVAPIRRERLEHALQVEPLSRNALTLSRDPDFWRYLEEMNFAAVSREIDEVHAKQYIFKLCDIQCRRDLDEDPEAANHYQTFILKPFRAWLHAQ